MYVLLGDDDRFINHSGLPNSILSEDGKANVAARDIHKGEEILEDYSSFDANFKNEEDFKLLVN